MEIVNTREILEYILDVDLIAIVTTILESNIKENVQLGLKLLQKIIRVALGKERDLQLSVAADLNMMNAQRVLKKLSSNDDSDIRRQSILVQAILLRLSENIGWQ